MKLDAIFRLRDLIEVSRLFTYATSADEVAKLTVERACSLLEADRAVLMLRDLEGTLSVRAAHGLSLEADADAVEPHLLVPRLRALLEVEEDRFVGVPLVVAGALQGMLALRLESAGDRDEHELFLSALADQASVALDKARLEEAARVRERVVGIVSHDLRNPIAAISMTAGTLSKLGNLDERTRKLVGLVQLSADRAGRMVRDLLDYTQAHLGGGIPIHKQPGDLGPILRHVIEEQELAHPSCDFQLTVDGTLEGRWDADRIEQVLGNLLSNALAHGSTDEPIVIEARSETANVLIRVHNGGAAIPPERLDKLFEPMRLEPSEQSAKNRSVALGLYIVKHLVEGHGGTVNVETGDAEGTSFTLTLPRA